MKKYLFILIAATLLVACGSKDSNEEQEKTKIRIDEKVEVNGAEINLQSIRIKEDDARLYADWVNKTPHESHLSYLAPIEIYQNGIIEIDTEKQERKVKSGVVGGLDIKFKLNNTEDSIEIKIFDKSKDEYEVITIDIP